MNFKAGLIALQFLLLSTIVLSQQCTQDANQRCICSSSTPFCSCSFLTPTNSLNFSSSYRSHLVLVAGQGCRPCAPNCLRCSSLTVCSECLSSFYLSGAVCIPCPVNCGVCANGVCSSCRQGYYLDYQLNCQSCPIIGTRVCTISSLISCQANYWLDNNAANCVRCDSYCQQCSSTTRCSICLQGYYLTMNYTCSGCRPECLTCSSSNDCLLCTNITLFYNSTLQQCMEGAKSNCAAYTSINTCSTCNNQSYLDSFANCILVPSQELINNCQTYALLSNGTLICQNCTPGYYNRSVSCTYGCSVLCTSCYGAHYGLCYGCLSNSILYNLHCLPNYNIEGGSAFQLYYTAFNSPTFFGGATIRSAGCLPEVVAGETREISMSLNGLQSYKLILKWKIYLYAIKLASDTSYQYRVFFSNNQTNSTSTFLVSNTLPHCGDNLSLVQKNQLTLTSVLNQNVLRFSFLHSTEGMIGISQVLIVGYRCGGIQGAQCLECSSTSQCTKCANPNYYISGYTCLQSCPSTYYVRIAIKTCLTTCPSGTYTQSTNLLCLQCIAPCSTCSSQSECTSCLPGYYLVDSSCKLNCPEGYYADSMRGSCLSCLRPCLTCLSNLDCLSCLYGFYQNSTKRCVMSCGQGKYGNVSTLTCEACLEPCLTCGQYEGSKCLRCMDGYFLHRSQCLASCPSSHLSQDTLCVACDSVCSTCSGSTSNCTSCRQGRYLLDGKCLNSCPSGYFANAIDYNCSNCPQHCSACVNELQCLSCIEPYQFYSYNDSCLWSCPPGYYIQSGQCLPCQLPCLTCRSQQQCLSCSGLFLLESGCVSVCGAGRYADTATMQCLACNTSACIQCLGGSNACSRCQQGLILWQRSCVYSCPVQYFSSSAGKCESCPQSCTQCLNSTSCLSCTIGYILSGSLCKTSCQNSYYPAILNNINICQPCPCQSCKFSNGTIQCTSCLPNMSLLLGQCFTSCPSGTYSQMSACFGCSDPCESCVSERECADCSQGYFFKGACLTECPLSYYSQGGSCRQCDDVCLKCEKSNASKCSSCRSTMFFYEYSCVTSCPESYYASSNSKICRKCRPQCKICLNNSFYCLECSNISLVLSNGNCLTSCPSTQYRDGLQCLPCPSACSLCSNSQSCQTCALNLFLTSSWICVSSCPEGSYGFGGMCRKCMYPCLTCLDARNCLSCVDGYLNDNTCVYSCPGSTYFNQSLSICKKCPSNCSQCSSPTSCQQCFIGVLVNGQCEADCPLGYYTYYSVCLPCMYGCLNCSDSNNCFNCSSGFQFQGVCLDQCPPGWIGNSTMQCQKCVSGCSKCSISPDQCISCASGLFLYIFSCVSSCPDGTFKDYLSLSCLTCKTPCATCLNGYSCASCIYGYILYAQPSGNQCIEGQSCPNSFYRDIAENQCIKECPADRYIEPIRGTCSKPCPQGYVLLVSNRTCLERCPGEMWINSNFQCQIGNEPSLLPRFVCKALVVRNILVFDCSFNIEILNLKDLSTSNFSISEMQVSQLVLTSQRSFRLVTSQSSRAYQSTHLNLTLPYRYQLLSSSKATSNNRLLNQLTLPVQNTYNQIFVSQFHSYNRDQRRTGLQLMQISLSVCIGALIFWVLAVLKNLKATSLAFIITLQWLHSLSLLDLTHAPNLGQFLEGFKFANLFFSSGTVSNTLWILPNSYRQQLWGVVDYFSFQAVYLPSIALALCFTAVFIFTFSLHARWSPDPSEKSQQEIIEGSEEKEEPSLISNVESNQREKQRSGKIVTQAAGSQIVKDRNQKESSCQDKQVRLTSEPFKKKQSNDQQKVQWERTKIKIALKCKIIQQRFKFNYCFHILLISASPLTIGFYCQLIAPSPLSFTAAIVILVIYISVLAGFIRKRLSEEGRLFVSSKFSLLGWGETVILNGVVVLATAQIYIGVSLLLFLVNIYVWTKIFSSERQRLMKYFHQASELLRCLILLQVMIAYSKSKEWSSDTLYNFSWLPIVTIILLIVIVAVHSTKQFFDSEPKKPINSHSEQPKSKQPAEGPDPLSKTSFVFSGSLRNQTFEQKEQEGFFSEREGFSDSDSSEDIIDFDDRGGLAYPVPKELIKYSKGVENGIDGA